MSRLLSEGFARRRSDTIGRFEASTFPSTDGFAEAPGSALASSASMTRPSNRPPFWAKCRANANGRIDWRDAIT